VLLHLLQLLVRQRDRPPDNLFVGHGFPRFSVLGYPISFARLFRASTSFSIPPSLYRFTQCHFERRSGTLQSSKRAGMMKMVPSGCWSVANSQFCCKYHWKETRVQPFPPHPNSAWDSLGRTAIGWQLIDRHGARFEKAPPPPSSQVTPRSVSDTGHDSAPASCTN